MESLHRTKFPIANTFIVDYCGEFVAGGSPGTVTNVIVQDVGTADASVYRFVEWFPCGLVAPSGPTDALRFRAGNYVVTDVASSSQNYFAFVSTNDTGGVFVPVLESPSSFVDILSTWQIDDVYDYVSNGPVGLTSSWIGQSNAQMAILGRTLQSKMRIELPSIQLGATALVTVSMGTLPDGRTQAWTAEDTFRVQSDVGTYQQNTLRNEAMSLTFVADGKKPLTPLSTENRNNFNLALFQDYNFVDPRKAFNYMSRTTVSAVSRKNSLVQNIMPSGQLLANIIRKVLVDGVTPVTLSLDPSMFISPDFACVATNFAATPAWSNANFPTLKCLTPPLFTSVEISGSLARSNSAATPQAQMQGPIANLCLFATHVYVGYQVTPLVLQPGQFPNYGNMRTMMQTEKLEFPSWYIVPPMNVSAENTYSFKFSVEGKAGFKWLGTFLSFYLLDSDSVGINTELVQLRSLQVTVPLGATTSSYGPLVVARVVSPAYTNICVSGEVQSEMQLTAKALQRLSLQSSTARNVTVGEKRGERVRTRESSVESRVGEGGDGNGDGGAEDKQASSKGVKM